MLKKFALITILIISGLGLLSCNPAPAMTPPETLKIVASFPLQNVALGQSAVNSIKLALADVDYQVNGIPIELVVLDDGNSAGQWQTDLESANANQAADDMQVIAYLGPLNSGAAKASIPITNKAGLLQISPANTWPGLTKVGFAPGEPGIYYPTGQRNYFRTAPTDDLQAPAAVNWAGELGFNSVYILDDGEVYGKGLADLFEAFAQDGDLTVVERETIDKMATDFSDVLSRIQNADPPVDLIYYGGYSANGADRLLQQRAEMGLTAAFMGPDAIVDSNLLNQAGPAAEGVYATLVGVPPAELETETGQAFVQRYEETYQEKPEAFSQFAYDATLVVLDAIARSETPNRHNILKAVRDMKGINGAAGYTKFDAQGDTNQLVVSGNVVQNGQYQFLGKLAIK